MQTGAPDTVADAAIAAAAAAPPPAEPAAAPPGDDAGIPDGVDGGDDAALEVGDANPDGSYPKATVDKLRDEAKNRRLQLRETEAKYEPIANLGEDNVNALNQFAHDFAAGNDERALKFLLDSARAIAGDRFDELVGATPAAAPATDAGLTQTTEPAGSIEEQVQAAVAKAIAEQQQAQMVNSRRDQLVRETQQAAESLGYERGTPAYQVLLQYARTQDPKGSIADRIQSAHEALVGLSANLPGAAGDAPSLDDAARAVVGGPPRGTAPASEASPTNLTARQKAERRIAAMTDSGLGG